MLFLNNNIREAELTIVLHWHILDLFWFFTVLNTAYTTIFYSIFMEIIRGILAIFIAVSLLLYNSSNVEGRSRYHKPKNKSSKNPEPPVSPTPYNAPDPQNPTAPSSPSNSPSIPSDPYPNDPGNTSSDYIFNVMDYGAVGDGSTDDTNAFRQAWKEACGVESGVILAPSGYSFMITSSIFSGPCKPGIVFQVRIFISTLFLFVLVGPGLQRIVTWIGGWVPNAAGWTGFLAREG